MNYSSPENQGIRSSDIEAYIRVLEEKQLSTHSLIIARHGSIVFEKYWAPFHKDFLHRMYSTTKSYASIGVGFLEQDGLVDLDDPIAKYFPEEIKVQPNEYMKKQTIRDMLKMCTAKAFTNWFIDRCRDRVQHYFDNDNPQYRPAGTVYQYDSEGSFILGALVERVTGKRLLDYLREKAFDEIGFSKEAYLLECPGGHSWADSALICKSSDMLKVAMWLMNKGVHNGKQLLNAEYIEKATSKQADNDLLGTNEYNSQGYGYQIWRCYDNSFMFVGMGNQFAVCVPDKDIVMVITSDNQGHPCSGNIIIDNFFDLVVRRASDVPLAENEKQAASLEVLSADLKLQAAHGEKHTAMQDSICGVEYTMEKNPMGITKMKLCFEKDKGVLYYTNAQGDKEIPFGMCYNEFAPFPQSGYADKVGTKRGDRLYNCAASGAWTDEKTLFLKVQVIDTYFGRLNIKLGFDGKMLGVYMCKSAEDFLGEYQGFATGKAE